MAVVSWTRDFTLTSPLGALTIPAVMLVPSQCTVGVGLRGNTDPVPAGDGTIFHSRFKDGYQMNVVLQLIQDGALLVGSGLQDFFDTLMSHLDLLVVEDGRIEWTIDGAEGTRMLSDIRTFEVTGASGSMGDGTPKQFAFGVETPYPYAMTTAETETDITDSTPVTITRGGSAKEFWPLMRVLGPTTAFTVKNNTSGLQIAYDSTLPEAEAIEDGHYAEIDFFRKTVTLDGDVHYLEEGVVWGGADFWPLIPGDNEIEVDGADAEFHWNDAWA